jgi:hypothetical protein
MRRAVLDDIVRGWTDHSEYRIRHLKHLLVCDEGCLDAFAVWVRATFTRRMQGH